VACDSLEAFVNAIRKPVIEVFVFGRPDHANVQSMKERNDAVKAAFEAFRSDIPAARKTLEGECRRLLGVG
jgi:hypothetical protein